MLAGYDNGYNLNQRFKVHLQQFGVYAESQVPKLISREIIFAEFRVPTRVITIHQRYKRRTDNFSWQYRATSRTLRCDAR